MSHSKSKSPILRCSAQEDRIPWFLEQGLMANYFKPDKIAETLAHAHIPLTNLPNKHSEIKMSYSKLCNNNNNHHHKNINKYNNNYCNDGPLNFWSSDIFFCVFLPQSFDSFWKRSSYSGYECRCGLQCSQHSVLFHRVASVGGGQIRRRRQQVRGPPGADPRRPCRHFGRHDRHPPMERGRLHLPQVHRYVGGKKVSKFTLSDEGLKNSSRNTCLFRGAKKGPFQLCSPLLLKLFMVPIAIHLRHVKTFFGW